MNSDKKQIMMADDELMPDFIEKIKKEEHLKGFKFKSVDELRKKYKRH